MRCFCEHQDPNAPDRGDKTITICARLREHLGYTVTASLKVCHRCMAFGMNKSDMATDPQWKRVTRNLLAARLTAGDFGKTQEVDPVDVDVLFDRYAALANPSQQRELIKRLFRKWCAARAEHGAHPVPEIVAKLHMIAQRHKCPDVIPELVSEYQNAQRRR